MLDVSIRLGVLNLLDDLRVTEGIATMYVTHDIASARYLADTVVVMYAGQIVESGPATRSPTSRRTRTRSCCCPPRRTRRGRSSPRCWAAARPRAWSTRRAAAGSTRAARSRWRSARSPRPRPCRSAMGTTRPAGCTAKTCRPPRRRRWRGPRRRRRWLPSRWDKRVRGGPGGAPRGGPSPLPERSGRAWRAPAPLAGRSAPGGGLPARSLRSTAHWNAPNQARAFADLSSTSSRHDEKPAQGRPPTRADRKDRWSDRSGSRGSVRNA